MKKSIKRSLLTILLFLFYCLLASCKKKEDVVVELPSDAFMKEDLTGIIGDTDNVFFPKPDGKDVTTETDLETGDLEETESREREEDRETSSEANSDKESPSEKPEEEPSEEKQSEKPPVVVTDTPVDPDRRSFYQEGLSQERRNAMAGVSYPADGSAQISLDDLRYLHILHYDFDGNVKEGEIVCNKSISDDLLDIFYELYLQKYPITSVKLIDEFGGDDTLSMEANNTSAFNYRVVSGTDRLSKHAMGVAIDINPQINPYVVLKNGAITRVSPENGTDYADRSKDFPGKIDKNDLCYKLFHDKGFFWGGDWKTTKDYQHFQKTD